MKNIVITGTSRGIGLELVRLFVSEGHRVIALSRKSHESFSKLDNVIFIPTDLSDSTSIQNAGKEILEVFDKVDVIVHNAGTLINKPFEKITLEDFEYVYRVNVFGVAELNRGLLPVMSEGSHVVTISSMGGVQGSMKFPGLAAYSSSKAAVITLSELLAEEYKDKGISFNVLALGAVQTEMLEEAFPGYIAPLQAIEMAAYIKDFALTGNRYFNGKLLQVSSTTP